MLVQYVTRSEKIIEFLNKIIRSTPNIFHIIIYRDKNVLIIFLNVRMISIWSIRIIISIIKYKRTIENH